MPQLPEPPSIANVQKLFLPVPETDNIEDKAWVEMDLQPINGKDLTASSGVREDAYGHWLTRRISNWNFADVNGQTLPITYENVTRLGATNITYLTQQPLESIAPLTDDQKKTSENT
jgi:hypothetical protein